MLRLRIKAAIVGSTLEPVAQHIRRIVDFPKRRRHPELSEIYLENERLPLVLDALLTKDSNTIDVGCHIGSFLSRILRLCPDGSHCAIEASPTKATWLKRKFTTVRIEQVAVSDYIGTGTFEENIGKPGFSRLQGGHPSADLVNRYDVAITTLDALDLGSPDLIKIDIEGAELAALKGGTELVRSSRPKIIFECGADANAGLDRSALFDYLNIELKYDVFTFADFLHDKGRLEFDEFRKCGIYPFRAFNFIALPR